MPSLTVFCSGAPPQAIDLHAPVLTVGRDEDCDVRIDEDHISGLHARLKREADGSYRLIDLDSSNGTSLNGRPLGNAILEDGDRVTFGVYVRALFKDDKAKDNAAAVGASKPEGVLVPAVARRAAAAPGAPQVSSGPVVAKPASAPLSLASSLAPDQVAENEAALLQQKRVAEELETRIEKLRGEQGDVTGKIKESRARLAQVSQEIATAEHLCLQSESEYERLQATVEESKRQLENGERLQRIQTQTFEDNKARVHQLIEEKHAIETELEESRNRIQQEVAAEQRKLDEVRNQIAEARAKAAEIEAVFPKRQKELADLVRVLDRKRAEADREESRIQGAKDREEIATRLADTEARLDALTKEHAALAADTAAKEHQVTALQEALDGHQAQAASAGDGTLPPPPGGKADRLAAEIHARQESLDYLTTEWTKTKLELANAREQFEKNNEALAHAVEVRREEAASLDAVITARRDELAAFESKIEAKKNELAQVEKSSALPRKRARIEVPIIAAATAAATTAAAGASSDAAHREQLARVAAELKTRNAELESAREELARTNAEIKRAAEGLRRSQNANGRYVPPPANPIGNPGATGAGHRLPTFHPAPAPAPQISPFASAADPRSEEERHLALNIVAPANPRLAEQSSPDGAGAPDLYLHPPLGIHSLAASTHGNVLTTLDHLPPAPAPVLLAMGGDFEEDCRQMKALLAARPSRPVLLGLSSEAVASLNGELTEGNRFQQWLRLLGSFDGVITRDPGAARLVDSLQVARHHLHLPGPCPVDAPEWDATVALDKRRRGLFLAADGFDPANDTHRALVDAVNRLAHDHGFPITVHHDAREPAPIDGLDVPDELLDAAPPALDYNEYVSLAARHPFVAGFARNPAGGEIWGDALLSRNLYLGTTDGCNASRFYPGTCLNDPAELARVAAELQDHPQAYRDHIEKAQWLALENVSFRTARTRLEDFVSRLRTPQSEPAPSLAPAPASSEAAA